MMHITAPNFTTPMSGGYEIDALNLTLTVPSSKVVNWFINGSTMSSKQLNRIEIQFRVLTKLVADWDYPTLASLCDNKTFEPNQNVIKMPEAN
jgi:hypothetical protein